ncbi:MAG: carboxypeptidase M32 [Calditrichota bacterium]
MADFKAVYQDLLNRQKEIALLNSVSGLLEWGERTYLPEDASFHRADQIAYMAGMIHEKSIHPRVGELLTELESRGFEDEYGVEAVNVREWRRDYDKKIRLPSELVQEMSRVAIHAQKAWKEARRINDFKLFQPWLEKTVNLKQREADCYSWEGEPYNALLDTYEPGARSNNLGAVLTDLREALVPLVRAVAESPLQPNVSILHRSYPAAAQESFAKEVAKSIGYQFGAGRLDPTAHPFCTGLGPRDVRITTRYDENFLNGALFGVIHEAGHGLYEQNLPAEHWGTPRGEAVSLGFHESQSRLWENFVARGRAFWEFWYPRAQQIFTSLDGVSLDDFHFAVNQVKPSFIRVEADEVTYNLHILLRFEIERGLISGDLKTAEAPVVWNERFQNYFGIPVPDEAHGVLQDIHWSAGLIGYFPTYSLGNLNAAQIFAAADRELGGLDEQFRNGRFDVVRRWLTEKIHSQGRRYHPDKLIEVVTGQPLSAQPLVSYLKNKFSELYQVKL